MPGTYRSCPPGVRDQRLGLTAALAARRPGVPLGTGIVPLPAATDSSIARGAATAAALSGTTYYLGVGTSTEQIVGGWHVAPYDASVAGTRDRLTNLRATRTVPSAAPSRSPRPPETRSASCSVPSAPGWSSLG